MSCNNLLINITISNVKRMTKSNMKKPTRVIIIIIITKEYDYGGVMSEDCKDTLQTK